MFVGLLLMHTVFYSVQIQNSLCQAFINSPVLPWQYTRNRMYGTQQNDQCSTLSCLLRDGISSTISNLAHLHIVAVDQLAQSHDKKILFFVIKQPLECCALEPHTKALLNVYSNFLPNIYFHLVFSHRNHQKKFCSARMCLPQCANHLFPKSVTSQDLHYE